MTRNTLFLKIMLVLITAAFLTVPVAAMAREAGSAGNPDLLPVNQRVEASTDLIRNMMNSTGDRIPPEVIKNAKAVAIFPRVTNVGLIIGGTHGNGVLMLQQDNKWNGPLFVSLTRGSLGAQAGIEQSDLVMVFNTTEALKKLETGSLNLGAEASIAAGPYGAKANTSTGADVLAYQSTRGAFIGAALSSGRIIMDANADNDYYRQGKEEARGYFPTGEQIIDGKKAPTTSRGSRLASVLYEYETRK